jgi:hypothetical protein
MKQLIDFGFPRNVDMEAKLRYNTKLKDLLSYLSYVGHINILLFSIFSMTHLGNTNKVI